MNNFNKLYKDEEILNLLIIYKHFKNYSKEIKDLSEYEKINLFKIFIELKGGLK